MQIVIDIPEETYKEVCKLEPYCLVPRDTDAITDAIRNGTPIPDNATNDDVLKALFDERGYMGIHDRMMHTKWLFAPYQKGGKE